MKKHWVLSLLCILTFVGSGFGLLVSVISLVDIQTLKLFSNIPNFTSTATNIADSHFTYSIFRIIVFGFSIFGAYKMFKLKKVGFFIYASSQIFLLILSSIYFPYPFIQVFFVIIPNVIFTIAFIGLYSLHIDFSKKEA